MDESRGKGCGWANERQKEGILIMYSCCEVSPGERVWVCLCIDTALEKTSVGKKKNYLFRFQESWCALQHVHCDFQINYSVLNRHTSLQRSYQWSTAAHTLPFICTTTSNRSVLTSWFFFPIYRPTFLCHIHSGSFLLTRGLVRGAFTRTTETTSNKKDQNHPCWAHICLISLLSFSSLRCFNNLSIKSYQDPTNCRVKTPQS